MKPSKSLCLYFQIHQPARLRLYRFFDIGKDAAVGVFAFPQVKLTVNALLPLDYTTVCLPFLNKNGVQFKLNAAQFLLLPPSERKNVIVERTAAVGADIEGHILYACAATEINAHKRTVSLSQMSNDELARVLSWRETVG